uniref:Uncharacterized protein n=1 Tax=Heterorhabditis bacteriophora TaxID=37862 RepID=A0A1I7W5U8_HETBA
MLYAIENKFIRLWVLLPRDRAISANPYEHTGIDFLGTFECKNKGKNVRMLIHMLNDTGCVEDLSAGAFLKCLQRFVARRGVPKIIRKIFVLQKMKLIAINSYMTDQRIIWIFNPPNSPWMGGTRHTTRCYPLLKCKLLNQSLILILLILRHVQF